MIHESMSRMGRWPGARAASITLTSALVACSSVESTIAPPLVQGTCSASVAGEGISSEIDGSAVFGYQTGARGSSEFVLFLWEGNYFQNTFDIITMFRTNLDIPEPGVYEIQDASGYPETHDDFLAGWVYSTQTAYATFLSVSGTVTITESSMEQVSGTFEFTGAQRDDSFGVETDSVTVAGSFTAVQGEIPR